MSRTNKAEDLFNYLKLQYIIDNWDSIDLPEECKRKWKVPNHITGEDYEVDPLETLNKIINKKKIYSNRKGKHIASVSVSYHLSKTAIDSKYKYGRQYVKNALGIQSINGYIRNTICCDVYDDIDIVNCHSTLLTQLCKKKEWDCCALQYYNDNREECLKSMMEMSGKTRKECKTSVIIAMYNNGEVCGFNGLEWFDKYKQNIKSIQSLMATDPEFEEENKYTLKKRNEKIKRAIEQNKSYKDTSLGSLCSLIMNSYENNILEECVKFLQHKGKDCLNLIKMFDGFMYPKGYFNETLLKELEKWIEDKTGWKINFILKPMTDVIKLPDNYMDGYEDDVIHDTIVVEDDRDATKYFVECMKDIVKVTSTSFYIQKDNVWCGDITDFDNTLNNECLNMNICVQNSNGVVRRYSSNKRGRDTIVSLAKDMFYYNRDDKFEETLFYGSVGKTCFKNGVYDWKTKTFTDWKDNPNVYTTVIMPMDYNTERNEDKIKEVKKKILISCFDKDKKHLEMGDDFMKGLARAMSGNPVHKFSMSGFGFRNSGKGVFTDLLKNTFGKYVEDFDAGVFKLNGMEESRRMGFLLKRRNARLLIANEVPEPDNSNDKKKENIVDGVLLKKCQGGDVLEGRNMYQHASEFKIHGKILLMYNDVPKFEPADCLQCMEMYDFPLKFVSDNSLIDKEKKTCYRLSDDTLKETYIRDPDVCMAFFHLLTDYYKENVNLSHYTKEYSDEIRESCGDDETIFRNTFKSGKENDYITSKSIEQWYVDRKLKMSLPKVKKWLIGLGYDYHNGKRVGANKRVTGYFGIQWIKPTDKGKYSYTVVHDEDDVSTVDEENEE